MQTEDTTRWKFWTIVDGVAVPLVRGADDGDGDDGSGDDGDGDGGDDGDKKSFSQDDLDRVGTREKSRGKRQGRKELFDELGVADLDELKAKLGKVEENDAEGQRDLDAQKEAAAKSKRDADQARKEADEERFLARVERRLIKADADPERLEKIARLLDFEDDVSELDLEDIDAAIDDLKKDMPELFTKKDSDGDDGDGDGRRQDADGSRGPRNSDPGRRNPKPPAGDPQERARQQVRDRHPQLVRDRDK